MSALCTTLLLACPQNSVAPVLAGGHADRVVNAHVCKEALSAQICTAACRVPCCCAWWKQFAVAAHSFMNHEKRKVK